MRWAGTAICFVAFALSCAACGDSGDGGGASTSSSNGGVGGIGEGGSGDGASSTGGKGGETSTGGAGGAPDCDAADDCDDDDVCTADACNEGSCAHDAIDFSDDEACTIDTCDPMDGPSYEPVVCAALDTCHVVGVCDPGTGVCSDPSAPNGTECDDSDWCTQVDGCSNGVCTGGSPVVCDAPGECEDPGTCVPATGLCEYPPKPAGLACGTATCAEAFECNGSGSCVLAAVDAKLVTVANATNLQRAGGVASITARIQATNVGGVPIPVETAIAPAPASAPQIGPHPYAALSMYRLDLTGVYQLGHSDTLHVSVADNTGCSCGGPSQVLYPGCSLAISTTNMADQFYLGPRAEVSAKSGAWTSLGSHFDGLPVDDVRDHNGEGDQLTHLLLVADADLQQGGTFYIEGEFLAGNDAAAEDNFAFYQVTPSFSANRWQFASASAIQSVPFVSTFGDASSYARSANGLAVVAVKTTSLGGGNFRYQYAVRNLTYDPGFGRFSVTIPAGVNVSAATFRDTDTNAANDWTSTIGGTDVAWAAPNGATDDLRWGSLYVFSFTANTAPGATTASLQSDDLSETLPLSTRGPQ